MGKDLKGKNLGRGIIQRPDGRYEARAVVNGIKIDLYDKSLSALKKKFNAEKTLLLQKKNVVRPDLTLGEWYDEWFEKCKSPHLKSDVSRKAYDRKIRNTFVRLLGDKKVVDITQLDIQDAANLLYYEENYRTRSIKEALGILKECLCIAIANKIILTNPVEAVYVQNDNEQTKERRVLDHWEQDVFLRETEDSYYKEPYRILLLTGMRIGEFSGLQWEDIDFEKKKIKVERSMTTAYQDGHKIMELTTPKTTNSYRYIPFFGETEQILLSWKDKQNAYKKKLGDNWRSDDSLGNLVFTTTQGSPITRYNIVHDIKRVEDNIRLKEEQQAIAENREPRKFGHIYPHAFRHTFATRCFEKGLDPLVVQNIMGHAHYSTTVSYTHVLEQKTQEAVQQAGNFLC